VSEERGAVSLALGGALSPVEHAQELRAQIDRFFRDTLPVGRRSSPLRRALLVNRREKLAALGASAALWWLLVHGARLQEVRVSIPIVLHAPPGSHASIEPQAVQARLRGPRRELLWLRYRLNLPLDASRIRPGPNRFALSARDLDLPDGVSVRPFEVAVRVDLELPHVGAQ
jgi:hypothetical protein